MLNSRIFLYCIGISLWCYDPELLRLPISAVVAFRPSSQPLRIAIHRSRDCPSSQKPCDNISFLSARQTRSRSVRRDTFSAATSSTVTDESSSITKSNLSLSKFLIQWRGEGVEGYSNGLRHWEFKNAFFAETEAILSKRDEHERGLSKEGEFSFSNALTYVGPVTSEETDLDAGEPILASQVDAFESAMQFVSLTPTSLAEEDSRNSINDFDKVKKVFQRSVERCSLIRNMFEIVAEGDTFEKLVEDALERKSFEDICAGGSNENSTWAIRLRRYSGDDDVDTSDKFSAGSAPTKQARYGKNARSPLTAEREAIMSMAPMVTLFQGKVNLANPDCKIYLFEGLKGGRQKVLARIIALGPKTSQFAPNTRICITTTPLCPIASFPLCNIARIREHQTVLDPFAGSCATLLAASYLAPSCRTVGIEIAHNGFVNRDDIRKDFETRSLPLPVDIIKGDSMCRDVRDEARAAIGGEAFDVIITDPPYGIREKMETDGNPPLSQLFLTIGEDRRAGTPLLKKGGRLVAFVPVQEGEDVDGCIPSSWEMEEAGLVLEDMREQPLNDILSRWLVSFNCVK